MKKLADYIRTYEGIVRRVIVGGVSLVTGAAELDELYREFERDTKPPAGNPPERLALANLTEPNQMTLWTSQDGSRKKVAAMTDAHLFYALAKCCRGEYPDAESRATGVRALKIEAFRRLRNELAPRHLTVDETVPPGALFPSNSNP